MEYVIGVSQEDARALLGSSLSSPEHRAALERIRQKLGEAIRSTPKSLRDARGPGSSLGGISMSYRTKVPT